MTPWIDHHGTLVRDKGDNIMYQVVLENMWQNGHLQRYSTTACPSEVISLTRNKINK